MAFAYFVYQADRILTETAEKRLQAMKEFAELGAGFKIAMRDLEIRGAGNLLGSQQHGHIASVGFEMYCKLLEEAVEKMKSGKKEVEPPKPDPIIDLQVEAYLDGGYIDDAMHKIEIYQRIAAIRKNEELHNLLDELIDRFGEPTKPVMHLLEVARIKNYARDLSIRSIAEMPNALDIYLLPGYKMPVKGMISLDKLFGRSMRALPDKNGFRFVLNDKYKKNITNFVTRLLMIAAGDEAAGKSGKETTKSE
jgi:transcription-repair coupling factor (superfamily II helicase)